MIFHDGDPGDVVHLVVRGHVAIRVTTPLGDVATLRVIGPGELFGELALVAPAPRRGGAVALDPVETLCLHRDQLEAMRRADPSVDRVLIEVLAAEVRRLSARLVEALFAPVEQRVWRCLSELATAFGGSDDEIVVIPVTQDDIAQMVGATRPTVNRLLRAAEAAGTVELARGRVEVLDRDAVERHAR